ncbi:MAG: tetratricopeptide repeat protein [Acidobacteriota bacterium]
MLLLLLLIMPFSVTANIHKDALDRLEQDKPIERELQGGERHSYQISLTVGQYLQVVVEQQGIDVVISLYDPDGNKLNEVDSPNGKKGPESLSLISEKTGIYRLEVRSLEENATSGKYLANIAQLRPATTKDQHHIAAKKLFREGESLIGENIAQGKAESLHRAIEKFQAGLLHAKAADNANMEVTILYNIALVHHMLGNNQTALDCFNQILPLLDVINDQRVKADVLNSIGVIYSTFGDNRKALDYYNKALVLSQATDSQGLEAIILNSIGCAYDLLGEKSQALDYLNQALTIEKALGNRNNEAFVLANLARTYRSIAESQKAIDCYNQALSISRALGNRMYEVDILSSIGVTYKSLGEEQKALDYFNQALPLLHTAGERRSESYTLNNIGNIYEALIESQRALDYYNQALAIARVVSDQRLEATILSNIGRVYMSLGESQKALDCFNQALVLEEATGDRNLQARTLNNIGNYYSSLQENQHALNYYNKALILERAVSDRELEANTLNNIGRTYSTLGESQKALDYFNQALLLGRDINNKTAESVALFGIARLKRNSGELKSALTLTEQALTIIESLRTKFDVKELRASYFASVQNHYEFYIDLLMRLHQQQPAAGYDALALQTSERARARTLLEALAEARVDIRQGINPDLLERERNLKQQLNAKAEYLFRLLNSKHTAEQEDIVRRDTERINDEVHKVEALIYKDNPHYAALKRPQPLTLTEIQQKVLDNDTLLLEYTLGSEQSYLWAVTTNSITSYKLPKRADVEAAALRVYQLFTSRPRKSFETNKRFLQRLKGLETDIAEATAQLSRIVLAPVAEHLNKKRLLIVSEGLLQYIPFAALPTPSSLAKQRNRQKISTPLIVEYEIINLPSASSLALQREELAGRAIATKEIAIFANPVFSIQDNRVKAAIHTIEKKPDNVATNSLEKILAGLEPIPETEQMAKQIISLLPKSASKLLLGFNANLTMATQQEIGQYKIVHYATHGFLNPNPELSGVVLSLFNAEGKQQQGFLSAAAIFNLNLPADLVVLSACRSGLALDPEESDNPLAVKQVLDKSKDLGLTGLTRGFVYAGAARVMVTLWNIPVTATTEMMVRFYKQMLGTKKLSAAAALRAAQIQMLRQPRWNNPYYWAAFVINGEYR